MVSRRLVVRILQNSRKPHRRQGPSSYTSKRHLRPHRENTAAIVKDGSLLSSILSRVSWVRSKVCLFPFLLLRPLRPGDPMRKNKEHEGPVCMVHFYPWPAGKRTEAGGGQKGPQSSATIKSPIFIRKMKRTEWSFQVSSRSMFWKHDGDKRR